MYTARATVVSRNSLTAGQSGLLFPQQEVREAEKRPGHAQFLPADSVRVCSVHSLTLDMGQW